MDFEYNSDFDENGLLYFIGTDYGLKSSWTNPAEKGIVEVDSSSLYKYSEPLTHLGGRIAVYCKTKDIPNSWMKGDLKNIKIRLTQYTLRHFDFMDRYALRYWNLEGSNDGYNGR